MKTYKGRGKKRALKQLEKAQHRIEKFVAKQTSELTKRGHKKLRKLLKRRARALSNVTGTTIHSLFD